MTYSGRTDTTSRRKMTAEELETWRNDLLSLDIPGHLASSNRKLNHLPTFGMHLYVRQDFVRDLKQWRALRHHKKFVSSVFINGKESNRSVRSFVQALSTYELERFETRNKKKNFSQNAHSENCQPIILNTFKFCLPPQMTQPEQFRDFAIYMANHIAVSDGQVLPFFYMVASSTVNDAYDGDGATHEIHYLWLCTTERFWYPKGKKVAKTYNRDYYYVPATGKTSTTDVDGAILKHKKGEIFGYEIIHFSLKTRVFSFPGKKAWQGFLKKVRGTMLTYFKEHHYGNEVFMMPRLQFDNYRSRSRKHMACRTVNLFMAHMEHEVSMMTAGFYALNIADQMHQFFAIFTEARRRLIECMQQGSYRKYGRSWKVEFNAAIPLDMLGNNLDEVGDVFIQSIKDQLAPLFANA